MITINDTKYLTSKEAAAKLGVNIRTFLRYVKEKRLTVYRPSEKKIFVTETNMEKFIKGE